MESRTCLIGGRVRGKRVCERGEEEHVQRSCGRSGHVVKGRLWLELRVGKHL